MHTRVIPTIMKVNDPYDRSCSHGEQGRRPTKLITMKVSSHQSLAAEIRREIKRKATVSVLRTKKVTLKLIRHAASPIMVKHVR